MLRTIPEVPEYLQNLPVEVVAEVRRLFEHCFVTCYYGGVAFGHTKNRDVAERLGRGWVVGEHEDDDGIMRPTTLSCGGGRLFKMRPGEDEPQYYEFSIPAALVGLTREIIEERKAA